MRYIHLSTSRSPRPRNPIVQALALVAGIAAFLVAAVIGGIVLAAIVGVALIAGLVAYVRIWWLARKIMKQQGAEGPRPNPGPGPEGSIVEAEYEVISRDRSDNDRP